METARLKIALQTVEYLCVAQTTTRPALLVEADQTPLDRATALALIELLAEHCAVARPRVTFGKRAWARPSENRLHLRRQGLNARIVVHEFAHLTAPPVRKNGRNVNHGPDFVAELDRLVVCSVGLWRSKRFDLLGAVKTLEDKALERKQRRAASRRGQDHELLRMVAAMCNKAFGGPSR